MYQVIDYRTQHVDIQEFPTRQAALDYVGCLSSLSPLSTIEILDERTIYIDYPYAG